MNLMLKNETIRQTEYYDYDNNRFRVDKFYEDKLIVEIYDYQKNEYYEISNWESCKVEKLSLKGEKPAFDPETHHVRNASELFQFGEEFPSTYRGKEIVRGIPCDRWDRNSTYEDNGAVTEYTVIYYFSDPSWTIYEGDHPDYRVPIQTVFKGVYRSEGKVIPIHVVYEWVFFESGQPAEWHFDIVRYLRCGSIKKMSLPKLPEQFYTEIEMTIQDKNYTASVREFYDSINQRARFEFERGDKHVIEIHRFDEDPAHRYEIYKGINCTKIEEDDARFTEGGKLRNTSELFHFGRQFPETYEGERIIRGIPCDFWITDISHETSHGSFNYTLSYYFSVERWDMKGRGNVHRLPVRAEIAGHRSNFGVLERFHHIYDFIDFIPGEPDIEVFEPEKNLECKNDNDKQKDNDEDDDDDDKGGMSAGGVVGIAFLFLVIGGAIGASVVFFLLKRKFQATLARKYQTQQDLH